MKMTESRDAGKHDRELQISDPDYIRNRGLKGRDKIQDKLKTEVYVIVGKSCKCLYCVKCENSTSGERNENRMELEPVFK